ncbi:NAD(P)-dependent dehydrogenase (short-subunit alcohol dehydrogenase family) [Kibdelosporangium banguiense]|uniref:NAD(P)-dependent dehydrogenase (Short-subunit alcohol dehydrogenase family) n=1 Tax=Kibdelosporangium banguiense TaxID=1365924 RepID=A0ABS4U3D9_9PSEU|nr:oxidoreductase [Kibdelosporangium banguiense]MBP2331183.1 NAD(P)-dependent dehydrogenase (short-subunit alcohol dehydrogenase family) [Kibdelosporangium banguiense]
MANWSEADIPDQSGRTVLITGANSGLGLRSAKVLAGMGARVLLACRNPERGRAAAVQAGSRAEFVELDLSDLASVRKAAAEVRERTDDRLDILMNNAGVMGTPFTRTTDGFELQFGVNHLGHAALTWLLMPALHGARVITVSSQAARSPGLNLDDPNFERRRYSMAVAYAQSKLANLIWMVELDRRARAAGRALISAGGHPGMTDTSLVGNSMRSWHNKTVESIMVWGSHLVCQSVEVGALPQLYAATAPDVRGGDYFAPKWVMQMFGPPVRVLPRAAARNEELGRRLWEVTAELTGVTPDF